MRPPPPIDKIRKLLRLAREAAASRDTALQREGALAQRRAEALMAKWDIDVSDEDDAVEPTGEHDGMFAQIAFEVAVSRECRAAREAKRGNELVVIGPRSAARDAAVYFCTLVRQGRKVLAEHDGNNGRGFQEAFWRAFAQALGDQLPRPRRAGKSSAPTLAVDDAIARQAQAVEVAIARIAKDTKKGREKAVSVYQQAQEAGASAAAVAMMAASRAKLPDLRVRRACLALPPRSGNEISRRFEELDLD